MRIAIVGPESCGKSTLALALAQYYSCAYVPEIAREYFANHAHLNYTIDDIISIAQLQQQSEDQTATQDQNLICDTSALVSRVWAEVRFGYCPAEIALLDTQSQYTLTLLCATDLPWEADPLRENPHNREKLFAIYAQHLHLKSQPYAMVSGIGMDRFTSAIDAIKSSCIAL